MREKESIYTTLLGMTGSGKSMAIGAMMQALLKGCVSGENGITMTATGSGDDAHFRTSDGDNGLSGILASVVMGGYNQKSLMASVDKNGKIGSSAAGTVDMAHYFLDLDVVSPGCNEMSQTVKIMDYRGGLLSLNSSNISENDISECKVLMDNLNQSEIIMILLDGIALAQYSDNESLRKEKTGADRLNALMNTLMKTPNKDVTVMVMITKVDSDKIPQELKAHDYQGLCDLACRTIDSIYLKSSIMSRNHGWSFAVIPVTAIGENNSVTKYIPEIDEYYSALKYNADIHQKNIDVALIYCIKNALSERYKYMSKEVGIYESRINEELNKPAIFNIKQRKETITYLTQEKNEFAKKRDKYMDMITAINDGFSNRFSSVRRFGIAK